jgi:DNA-binding MarR family transcriptional regulator
MSKIHITFEVLNFLSDQERSKKYNLTSTQRCLLIMLSKHKGDKGIYPSIKTLAALIGSEERCTRRLLKKLEDKGLITIQSNNGRTSNYTLSEVIHREEEGVTLTQGHMTLPPRVLTPSPPGHNTLRYNNRSNSINNRREGDKARPHSLPDNFFPDKESCALGESLGFEKTIISKFKDFVKDRGVKSRDWNARFRNFLRDERPPFHQRQDNNKSVTTNVVQMFDEIREERPYTPCDKETASRALDEIFAKLKLKPTRSRYEEPGEATRTSREIDAGTRMAARS